MVNKLSCLWGKDKETDKPLEKVLIPNKYKRESTIKYGAPRLSFLLARGGDN